MNQNNTNKFTPVNTLGEFGLIEKLTGNFKKVNPSTIYGIGDDAAVIDCGEKYMVITTDLLTEGIHFNLVYTPLKHLGYKSVMVNLSDVYAMNAIPKQITVSIALSAKFSVEHMEELYSGIKLACEIHSVDLIGGDTTSSMTGLTISITAIGEISKDKVVFRSGAKVNDLICVSGNLGASYMGLQLLERERLLFEKEGVKQPDFGNSNYILSRQLKPEARRDIIATLDELHIKPNAMIDISDGLSSELMHICKSSGVGCKIYYDKIPIAPETEKMAEEFNISSVTAALNGGEDYELLFTVPLSEYEKVAMKHDISVIGHITSKESGISMIMEDGSEIELKAQGWNALN